MITSYVAPSNAIRFSVKSYIVRLMNPFNVNGYVELGDISRKVAKKESGRGKSKKIEDN